MGLAVLGPVRLDGRDGPVPIEGRKTRQVLTLLALAAPRPMSVDSIARSLWDDPPPAATKTVQSHLSRLRTALASARPPAVTVDGSSAGYRLVAEAGALDVVVVEDLRRRARLASLTGDDAEAESLLREARDYWRGEPELPSTTAGDAEDDRLAEERLLIVEDHLAAMLAAGRATEAVGPLAALTAEQPLRERAWELRIRALYLTGRQTDALDAYRAVHRYLREEVGVEPGPVLQSLHRAVLDHALPEPPTRPPLSAAIPVTTADVPHYAHAGGVHVAYGRFGTGTRPMLLLNPTFIPVDAYLEEPRVASAITALAAGRRLLAFDRRGLGLSDPVGPGSPPTVAQWAADAVAVLDANGEERVDVFANADTSMVALLLAAHFPQRVRTLTLVNGYARFTSGPDYPFGLSTAEMSRILRGIHTPGEDSPVDVVEWRLPSAAGDPRFRAWWDAVGRRGASPRTAALVHRAIVDADVRHEVESVTCPVLLLTRQGCASYDPGHGRYLAAQLPDATLREERDPNDAWFIGNVPWLVDQVNRFVHLR
jgi:DNA-binding SARP family transcriptional activator